MTILRERSRASSVTSSEPYDDEAEFLRAVEAFKERAKRPFPYVTDYLAILKSLGYTRPGGVESR